MPEPGPLDVLVEIAAVGVCGSDVHYYEHGRIATRVVRAPHVLGHESAGRVVATGERVTKHRSATASRSSPGCRAGAAASAARAATTSAATCASSARRRPTAPSPASSPCTRTSRTRCPTAVSDEAGALMEPLSVALWACEKARGQRRRPRARHRRRPDRAAGRAGRPRARGATRSRSPTSTRTAWSWRASEHGHCDGATLGRGRRADRVLGPSAGAPRRHRRAAPAGTAVLVGMGGDDEWRSR